MSSNRVFSNHRNSNAGTTMKRRSDYRVGGGIGVFQEERNRYAPPQKRFRSETQTQFRSDKGPLYHHGGSNKVSRVSSQSYNNYVDNDVIASNSCFAIRNYDSNINYQKPFVSFANPNPQIVPIPLPYRNLDVSFESLPEWVPNESVSRTLTPNFPIASSNFAPNTIIQAPAFANSMHLNQNMASIVSQSMSQPIVVSKELTDLLSVLTNEKEKQTSVASKTDELPLGLSFDNPSSLRVRHESVIQSLYSDMPRQCSSCGVRFKCQEDHSKHMDWHVSKNRMAKTSTRMGQKPQKSRGWLPSTSLWLGAATGEGTVEAAKPCFGGETQKKEEEKKEQVVPADEDQKRCALCEEPFEEFFSHEADDWMYKDAVYLRKNGPIVHAICMPQSQPTNVSNKPPSVMSVTTPSILSEIVC